MLTVHYCQAKKSVGTPVVITMEGKQKYSDRFKRSYKLANGKTLKLSMIFKNSKGKAKASGATTVMEITEI